MSYAKPWTNDQIDILSSERARARMELLIGVAPLYNIEFFGDKKNMEFDTHCTAIISI